MIPELTPAPLVPEHPLLTMSGALVSALCSSRFRSASWRLALQYSCNIPVGQFVCTHSGKMAPILGSIPLLPPPHAHTRLSAPGRVVLAMPLRPLAPLPTCTRYNFQSIPLAPTPPFPTCTRYNFQSVFVPSSMDMPLRPRASEGFVTEVMS